MEEWGNLGYETAGVTCGLPRPRCARKVGGVKVGW